MQTINKKNLLKIAGAIIFILMILATTSNTFVLAYSVGDTKKFDVIASDENLYCLMHYYEWKQGSNFYCYGTGKVAPEIAYIVQQAIEDNKIVDLESDLYNNAIWEYVAGNANASKLEAVDELLDKASVVAQIKPSDKNTGNLNLEVIKKPETNTSATIKDGKKSYGPFVINYPHMIKEGGIAELAGGSIKIYVNNKSIMKDTTGLKEFYLTEDDGIVEGQQNTIKIVYTAKSYTGTYALFTPETSFTVTGNCLNCSDVYNNKKINGFWVPKDDIFDYKEYINNIYDETKNVLSYRTIREIESRTAEKITTHKLVLDKDTASIIASGPSNGKKGYQDLIYVEPLVTDVNETETIKFYAGVSQIELDLKKVNTSDEELSGAEFSVAVENGTANVKTANTTDNIIITPNSTADIKVTLTETNVPEGYLGLQEAIVITYKWNATQGKWECTVSNNTITLTNGEKVTIGDGTRQSSTNTDKFEVSIQNRKLITLSGKVWLDDQTGVKVSEKANNKQDEKEIGVEKDTGLKNVKITLWKQKEKIATQVIEDKNNDGKNDYEVKTTKTNSSYSFSNIPELINKDEYYFIQFTYDGINYIAVTSGIGGEDKDSDASEINRDTFNSKFQTIKKGNAIGEVNNKKVNIPLEYRYDKYDDKKDEAILKTEKDETVMADFAMNAEAGHDVNQKYKTDTANIDLGLKTKTIDLTAQTSAYEKTVTINGVSQTDTFGNPGNDIYVEEEKDNEGNPTGNFYIVNNLDKGKINLLPSDYNYRIYDYKLNKMEFSGDKTNNHEEVNEANELEVKVKYNVTLGKSSGYKATVNEIAYYYDTNYILESIIRGNNEIVEVEDYEEAETGYKKAGEATIDGKTYNKIIIKLQDSTLQGISNSLKLDLQFKVDIAKISSKLSIDKNIEMQNFVEIISYSPENSCVDRDSAPDNIYEGQHEDDSDDGTGTIIVEVLEGEKRIISGYVFEDLKTDENTYGNGLFDNGESKVDDVIVQLIGVKNINGTKYEYIWQETVSGSNTVKRIPMTKTEVEAGKLITYELKDENGQPKNQEGHYEFSENIIPGNYIVRFIYGDGTYYDTSVTADGKPTEAAQKQHANLFKYNGQDYKSALDPNYLLAEFKPGEYDTNASMARDNEARRLEEMAYATSATDASKLIIDNKDELTDTWMCAETSLIGMPIESNADISYNVNFGLIKRPSIKLKLEKHVTAVKIDGIGTSTIDMYEGDTVFLTLKPDEIGIIATPTSKNMNHRGHWTIQKQYDELAGRKLEITYTYRIKNTGAKEFIGNTLLSKLEAGETYKKIAEDVKKDYYNPNSDYLKNKEFGKYLGYWYYTGNPSNDENVTGTTKFKIEDYLSTTNGLQLDTNLTTSFKEIREANKNVWAYEETTSNNKDTVVKEEKVKVLQSGEFEIKDSYDDLTLTISKTIDSTSSATNFKYRSYAAQLVYDNNGGKITSLAGTLVEGSKPLEKVQSYVPLSAVSIRELVPEDDEFIAETVEITIDTGDDKFTPVVLIASITAGLAVVAVGIILVKKFVTK